MRNSLTVEVGGSLVVERTQLVTEEVAGNHRHLHYSSCCSALEIRKTWVRAGFQRKGERFGFRPDFGNSPNV